MIQCETDTGGYAMDHEIEKLKRDVIFRKMRFPEDRDFLYDIHTIYDEEYGLSRNPDAYRKQMEFFSANAAIYHPLMLLDGQKPAGYARAYDRISMSSSDIVMMLDLVYILPEYRGLGFGRIIMEKFLLFAENAGVVRIDLLTDLDNPAAVHLYESFGFKGRNRYQMILFIKDNPQLVRYFEQKKAISG
jgi:ribosomal protein S18 acetylase RimI-like enzyme